MQGIEQIKRGLSIFIMPEGTRNRNEDVTDLLPFHDGSFRLSTKTGCAIVPVAMKNTDKVIRKKFPWVKPANIVLEYGEPVYPADLSAEDKKRIGNYMQEKVKEMLENLE